MAISRRSANANRIGPLSDRCPLPLIKVIDQHKAVPPLKYLAEGRLALEPLGLGVEVGEANLDVLRRRSSWAQNWASVGAVGSKDELDLPNIGGEPPAAAD
jgi:hypothetical protein